VLPNALIFAIFSVFDKFEKSFIILLHGRVFLAP